jgi:hypothetical protein
MHTLQIRRYHGGWTPNQKTEIGGFGSSISLVSFLKEKLKVYSRQHNCHVKLLQPDDRLVSQALLFSLFWANLEYTDQLFPAPCRRERFTVPVTRQTDLSGSLNAVTAFWGENLTCPTSIQSIEARSIPGIHTMAISISQIS